MSLLEPSEEPQHPAHRTRLIIAAAVAASLIGLLAWVTLNRSPSPAVAPAEQPVPAPIEEEPPAVESETPAERPTPAPAKRRPAARPEPAPAPAPEPVAELRVDSDVQGAMVFLDRNYLGTTPLSTSEVTPGSHTLNVSAEGYEGHAETVDIVPGTNAVTVRFKEVRIDEAIDVVHKHTTGSCRGRLSADLQGLRYETTHTADAFFIPYSQVETFEVDYLKTNLRIKRRGGRTYNFTSPDGGADPLFVFHRNVQAARARLAGGASKPTP
jgi:hypothetical protein